MIRGILLRKRSLLYIRDCEALTRQIFLGKLMKQVVDSGTASALSGRSYTVAGKTGSAEFDEEGHSHSWFIGYSNVDDPDIVVAVIVENGGSGSEAAVPIAGQIFDAYYANN